MRFKKMFSACLCSLVLLLVSSLPAQAQLRIGLKLWGGYDYISCGECNEGTEGFLNLWKRQAQVYGGYSASGSYKPFHYGMTGGGDLIFYISPNFGIGIGAGYVQASSGSVVDLSRPGASAVISVDPKASAIPLRAGLYISLPMGASAGLVLHGGAGYYLGTFESLLRIEEGSDYIQWEQKAAGQGIGFHGGIGLEMNFGPHFGLILEGLGCLAKISGFDGDVTMSVSGFSTTESGKLYFYRVADAVLGTFPLTVINDSPPSGIGVSDVHEAAVDFSGFTVRAGLIFKF